MEEQQEILKIDKSLKGHIIYAKPNGKYGCTTEWLILVGDVVIDGIYYPIIRRLVSLNLKEGDLNYGFSPQSWDSILGYNFYIATEEQRKLLKHKLAEKGYKYIRILHKIVRR